MYELKNKIYALITLYNPSSENGEKIKELSQYVDRVFLCDNSGNDKKYYIYNINEASVTNTYDPNLFKSACYLYKELMKYGKKWGLENNSERCTKRFLLSTISSVVKDAHYL